jgi:tripartite-type tricarboxylate transporter receptor subunit TctC
MSHSVMTRRLALNSIGALAVSTVATAANADPLAGLATIVVGLAAGGATDVAARRLAEGFRGTYAKGVLVDNRTGAGARLAIQYVKAAAPNGATLLLTPASMLTIYPQTYKNLAYDPVKDLVPVAMVSISELGYGVGPAVPDSVKTVADYQAWIKTSATAATFGNGATGSGPHFLGELLGRMSGVKMAPVGYRGSQPAILDLLGGHTPAVAAPLGEFLPHMKTGGIRLLAVTGNKRSRFVPEVPTFKESGIALSDLTEWFGVFAPAGTEDHLVQRANAAIKSALMNPELVDAYGQMGMEAAWSSPTDLGERLRSDIQRWRGVVAQLGFTADS